MFQADGEILTSLKKAQEYVDVIIVGKKLDGFECFEFSNEEEASLGLLKLWEEGKVDEIVRGQVDDLKMVEKFKQWKGIDPKEKRVDVALLETVTGWQFFITGVSNSDAQDYGAKEKLALGAVNFLKTYFPQISIKVAVMATCKPESYGKDLTMSQTYDEAEKLVAKLQGVGIEARNVHIEIEKAKDWGATLLVPARGTIGNQIFRGVVYLGGGKNYLTPTYFPSGGIYEDASRNEKDWFNHLVFASYLAIIH
jgi:predicted methyltransferase MtxX (methanogen marker protein 4)